MKKRIQRLLLIMCVSASVFAFTACGNSDSSDPETQKEDVKEEDKEDPFVQGMEKVYKHLLTTLEGIEVKPIEAVGQPFDPNFHNAVMHVEDENFGENIVAEEFQKGHTYRDSVVRHSMVKVAN